MVANPYSQEYITFARRMEGRGRGRGFIRIRVLFFNMYVYVYVCIVQLYLFQKTKTEDLVFWKGQKKKCSERGFIVR